MSEVIKQGKFEYSLNKTTNVVEIRDVSEPLGIHNPIIVWWEDLPDEEFVPAHVYKALGGKVKP